MIITPHRRKNPQRCGVCLLADKREAATWIIMVQGRLPVFVCEAHRSGMEAQMLHE
jgi:hypothetical protein